MDASTTWRQVNDGYTQNYLGQDTLSLKLTHANVYFDWQPNDRSQALIELNLLPNVQSTSLGGASDAAVITYQGVALTDDEIYQAFAMQGIMAGIEAQVPEGTPNRDQVVQQQLGLFLASAEGQATLAGGIAQAQSLLGASLAQLRSSSAVTYNSTKNRILNIERAYFNILFNDQFTLRVGKWITPSGIWNVDHGSPVVLTVSQPYQTTVTPIFPESQMGLMGYGMMYLGDHDLSYNAWISNGRSGASQAVSSSFENSIDSPDDFTIGGHLGLNLALPVSVKLGATAQTGNLRRKYSVNTLEIDLMDLQNMSISNYNTVSRFIADERESIMGADARLEFKNFFVQGEANYSFVEDNTADDKSMEILGYYGLAGYKIPIGEQFMLTPYAMFEQVEWERGWNSMGFDLHGYGAMGFQSFLTGLNLSLFSNIRIKAEYNFVRLLPNDDEVGADLGGLPMGFKKGDLDAHIVSLQTAVAF